MPPSPQPAKYAAARAFCRFGRAAFTIGTKQTNTITVTVALQDELAKALTEIVGATVYLSDNADGSTLTATVPTSNVAIHGKGVITGTLTTNKALTVITDATGTFDLDLIQTAGGTTYYLVVIKPDGGLLISSAITF